MFTIMSFFYRNNFSQLLLVTAALCCLSFGVDAKKVEIDENALQLRLLDMGYRNAEQVKDFHLFRMNGWSYVDKSHILISRSPKRHYMLRLKRSCYGLNFALSIGLKTTLSRVTKFDKVVVYDSHIPNYCYIDSIYKVERIPMKERREYRKEKKRKKELEKKQKDTENQDSKQSNTQNVDVV